MPALKSDIFITIRSGEKSFSVGGVLLPDGQATAWCYAMHTSRLITWPGTQTTQRRINRKIETPPDFTLTDFLTE